MLPRTFLNVPTPVVKLKCASSASRCFVFVVELHVTLRQGVMRAVVVLQVVGAQAHRRVLQIHTLIGDEEVAFTSLRGPSEESFRVLAFPEGSRTAGPGRVLPTKAKLPGTVRTDCGAGLQTCSAESDECATCGRVKTVR